MPCGPQLVEAVARELEFDGVTVTPRYLQAKFGLLGIDVPTTRAIRYAIAELIKQGRARRDKPSGPVYAVKQEQAAE